jgi:pimeloyl-ACP methyl ester carboxylesterase
MSYTRVEGCELHWAEVGRGPPIILLHGVGDSHRTWLEIAPALARHRRVLMPDLAGHGLSERPDASYALAWHARIVDAWIATLGLRSVDLVGHSYGGGVALWMTAPGHRTRVRCLGLVAAGGLGRDVSLALRLASVPLVVEHLGQPFMGIATRVGLRAAACGYGDEEIDRLAAMNATRGTARAFARTVRDVVDWRGQHRHIQDGESASTARPPVALFWGENDRVIPIAHAVRATSLLGGAAVFRFANCGHFPHREAKTSFVHALEGFLDAQPAPTAALRVAA